LEILNMPYLAALRTEVRESEIPWIGFFKMNASGLGKTFGFHLLVLDLLDALEILARVSNYRNDSFGLFSWMRDLDCTVIVIGELGSSNSDRGAQEHPGFSRHREDYQADGIIHLKIKKHGEFRIQRRIGIVKIRRTYHSKRYHAIVIDKGLRMTVVFS